MVIFMPCSILCQYARTFPVKPASHTHLPGLCSPPRDKKCSAQSICETYWPLLGRSISFKLPRRCCTIGAVAILPLWCGVGNRIRSVQRGSSVRFRDHGQAIDRSLSFALACKCSSIHFIFSVAIGYGVGSQFFLFFFFRFFLCRQRQEFGS